MNTSNSKLLENKSFMELDGLVGLPNGVKPAPMKYNLSNELPKINGIYLGTFLKMRAWDRIRKTKPSLKEIINMVEK